MSLINEALKKAQRARTDGQPADLPPVPGGGSIAKRAAPRSAKTVALIGGGALALVLVSVGVTLYLINRPTAGTKPATVATAPVEAKAEAKPSAAIDKAPDVTAAPAPKADVPPITAATTAATPDAGKTAGKAATAATPPLPTAPAPSTIPKAPPATGAASLASTPAPPAAVEALPAQPAAAAKPDERVAAFVDSVRVTGIRSSGTDSRVLMNERVYRVNDVVERTLGIKLIKVSVDSLTFADANGVTYVKYF